MPLAPVVPHSPNHPRLHLDKMSTNFSTRLLMAFFDFLYNLTLHKIIDTMYLHGEVMVILNVQYAFEGTLQYFSPILAY